MTARRALRRVWRPLASSLRDWALLVSSVRVTVEGDSMLPALEKGDHLLISRLAYRFALPKHGDIVLLRDPSRPGSECIKRIMGLPGELLAAESGERLLGSAEYFVVGDNLSHSTDSRVFGPVKVTALIGRAWYRAGPSRRRGHLR